MNELIIRGIQHLMSSFIFDIPGITELKTMILRSFFKIGNNSYVSYGSILIAPHNNNQASIEIGDRVGIEHSCDIDYSGGLIIKNRVWISENSLIATHSHTIKKRIDKKKQSIIFSPLTIEDDAWIGANSTILGNVNKIGKGAVVGAGAVVTKDVKDWQIVAGVPAKVIGERTK